jgi:teichuronic acid biosynthesis protein TuaE
MKRSIRKLVISLLIISTLTGGAVYIGIKEFHLIRLMCIVSFILSWIHLSQKVKFNYLSIAIIFYFVWSTLLSATVSIIDSNFNFKDAFNYLILIILNIMLVYYMETNKEDFLRIVFKSSVVVFFIMLGICVWEVLTEQHLSISNSGRLEGFYSYYPTTFFNNQNDYAATSTLICLLVLIYNRYCKNLNDLLIIVIVFLNFFVTYVTSSRTTFAITFLGFIFIYIKSRQFLKYFVYSIIIAPFILYISGNTFEWFNLDLSVYSGGIDFIESESSVIRKNLYYYGLFSCLDNYGFGAGLNGSQIYYTELNIPDLMGAVNPHNYLIELLINNGIIFFFFYCCINIVLVFRLLSMKHFRLIFCLVLYFINLQSSSSSLFLWYHYVFFIFIVGLAYLVCDKESVIKNP